MELEDAGGACRLISLNKTLRAECERVLPMLQAAKTPAPEAEIMEILIRNAPAYNVPTPAGGNWAFLFGPYVDALEGLPAYAIEDAFLRWNRGDGHANLQMASFYPKPAQLVMLAQKGKAELYCAAYRAEKALAYAERKDENRRPPEEVRKQVGADLKALLGDLQGARAMPAAHRPRLTPQEMAAQLRAAAPPVDDVGDVI